MAGLIPSLTSLAEKFTDPNNKQSKQTNTFTEVLHFIINQTEYKLREFESFIVDTLDNDSALPGEDHGMTVGGESDAGNGEPSQELEEVIETVESLVSSILLVVQKHRKTADELDASRLKEQTQEGREYDFISNSYYYTLTLGLCQYVLHFIHFNSLNSCLIKLMGCSSPGLNLLYVLCKSF